MKHSFHQCYRLVCNFLLLQLLTAYIHITKCCAFKKQSYCNVHLVSSTIVKNMIAIDICFQIVEHLLVLSELLDLGFPEDKVSSALVKCNNDRDKALDILIL